MKFARFSKSLYDDAKKCPAYAYLNHVEKIRPEPSEPARRGIEFHALVDKVCKGELTREDAVTVASCEDVAEWLNNFFNEDPFAGEKLKTEVWFEFTRDGRVPSRKPRKGIVGKIDRIGVVDNG